MKVRNFAALLLKSTNPEEEITVSVDGKKLPFTITTDTETNEKILMVSTEETVTVKIVDIASQEIIKEDRCLLERGLPEEMDTEKTSPISEDLISNPLNSQGDSESKKVTQVKKGK